MLGRNCAGLLVLGVVLAAVNPARADGPAAAGPVPLAGAIEVGDVLDVSIIGVTGPGSELRKRVRVAADGTVSLYYMRPVKLAGLDVADAARAIRKACIEQTIEDVHWIDVERLESAAHSGIRPGALRPGDFVDVTIADLLGPNVESTHRFQIEDACQA